MHARMHARTCPVRFLVVLLGMSLRMTVHDALQFSADCAMRVRMRIAVFCVSADDVRKAPQPHLPCTRTCLPACSPARPPVL